MMERRAAIHVLPRVHVSPVISRSNAPNVIPRRLSRFLERRRKNVRQFSNLSFHYFFLCAK